MTTPGPLPSDKHMFTIIVPTHERPLLLRRTLRSLIAQTYQNFNVIVVDDSPAYIPPYEEFTALSGRYTYVIRSSVAGPSESRNMGLMLAKSEYVIFLDDDDSFEPGHLSALAKALESTSVELAFCSFKICHEDRAKTPPEYLGTEEICISDVTHDSVFVRNRIPNSCMVYRHDVVSQLRHDVEMRIYEDWDFLLTCLSGRTLSYVDINSVTIHKSKPTAPENMRRGNTRDDLIEKVMLRLYRQHPAPNRETQLARQSLLGSVGIEVALDRC